MEEKNKITPEEQILLNNLESTLQMNEILPETYLIGKKENTTTNFKACLDKDNYGLWKTYCQLGNAVINSTYCDNLFHAIIKFIENLCLTEELYQKVLTDFIKTNQPKRKTYKRSK